MREMSWSLKLFSVNGIPVRVHVTFLLVVVWAAYVGFTTDRADWMASVGFMVAFVLLLFVCVLLHELGHSLVAQLFGARVVDITLLPIGGLARMTKMPDRPYQEFVMSAAGPATNILLAILLGLAAVAWLGVDELISLAVSPWLQRALLSDTSPRTLLLLLIANNAVLALFNLIPAFPLDGGRMFRSLLAAVMSYRRATTIASYTGQVFALVLGMAGLLRENALVGLIALFVFFGAWQEREQTRYRANLGGLRVRQAMQPIGMRLHPLQTVGEVIPQAAGSSQSTYLVVDGGRLAGLMTRGDLLNALRRGGPAVRITQHMRRDIPQFSPDQDLTEAGDRIWQGIAAAIVVEEGQVIGTISRADLMRVIEALNVHPEALPRG